jgi:hypothetical protein
MPSTNALDARPGDYEYNYNEILPKRWGEWSKPRMMYMNMNNSESYVILNTLGKR